MYPFAQERADRRRKLTAAIAFWVIAIVFFANVSVLNGWFPPGSASPREPQPTASASPTAGAETIVETGASVVFPAPPERSEELIVIEQVEATLVLYSATTEDGTTYNLGVIEYPIAVNVSDPAVNLLGSVTGAAGNVGGRVVRKKATRVQGAPAITFRIAADTVTLQGRNVLDDRFLYAQNIAFKGARPADADAFFESLSLPPD